MIDIGYSDQCINYYKLHGAPRPVPGVALYTGYNIYFDRFR